MTTDRELVQRFQATGDSDAFEQLVERHTGKAYQLAYGLLSSREDAEEVVQDAFVRIFRALPRFRGDSEFTTWMYRIVVNLCNNRYRWNKHRGQGKHISIDAPLEGQENDTLRLDLPDETLPPDKELTMQEFRTRTEKAMQALPESYRQAVMMRALKEMDYDEIAAVLHCAVGTVKSRINRGREMLRKMLVEE